MGAQNSTEEPSHHSQQQEEQQQQQPQATAITTSKTVIRRYAGTIIKGCLCLGDVFVVGEGVSVDEGDGSESLEEGDTLEQKGHGAN